VTGTQPAGHGPVRCVRGTFILIFATSLMLLAGCAGIVGRGDWDPFRSGDDRRVSVVVVNQNISHVSVAVLAPGHRTRLGTVAGNSREGFSVPWTGRRDIRFELEAVGGERQTTVPLSISPGESVELIVRSPLRTSSVARR